MRQSAIIFKNNLPNFKILKIETADIEAIQSALKDKTRQAPMMFVGMQVVIDISFFDDQASLPIDLAPIKDSLMRVGINPIAVMTDNTQHRQTGLDAKLGALPIIAAATDKITIDKAQANIVNSTSHSAVNQSATNQAPTNQAPTNQAPTNQAIDEPKKTHADTAPSNGIAVNEVAANASSEALQSATASTTASTTDNRENQVIKHPIRSGQRIYAKGDLTIVGAVSHGAEVIADGNIHVYGVLRGRAIAGASGDTSAQIFCQKMAAELVAIAGNYKQLEAIDEQYLNQPLQIGFDGETISFQVL
ncbi:septum site-determining protein MinC [Ostreibacterium oceani]|uniref:Probable septum site-determining protein MinC n=1 Tax=Ostreibacterium oceani TaxID=2654998 RepID=A0A6N7EVF4_9GAMM|nr:septum site-determining protein MinC [Ostreibacterium oceani]MPV86452.1 septum site-determining protein MinC [Ostreibacterium oceani]